MIMVEVSLTLKNRHFFTMKSFLTMLQRPSVGQKCVFCINKVSITSSRNLKKCEKFKILLESCRVTSKLSADSFMGRWDRMVPQKMDFKKKIFEKVLISCGAPPWLVNCVILHQQNSRKSSKMSKNAIFQKSIIFDILAGYMIFH